MVAAIGFSLLSAGQLAMTKVINRHTIATSAGVFLAVIIMNLIMPKNSKP